MPAPLVLRRQMDTDGGDLLDRIDKIYRICRVGLDLPVRGRSPLLEIPAFAGMTRGLGDQWNFRGLRRYITACWRGSKDVETETA